MSIEALRKAYDEAHSLDMHTVMIERAQAGAALAEVTELEAQVTQLRKSIEQCLKRANGRQHEWGERAVAAFLYLEEAIEEGK